MHERSGSSGLPLLGVLTGLWAMVPPYVEPFGALAVRRSVELLDHVVPGAVVLAVALAAYLLLGAGRPAPMLLGGLVISLAGLWILATHVGLVAQARQGIAPSGAVAWHGLPGIGVTLLGVVWSARFWSAGGQTEAPP